MPINATYEYTEAEKKYRQATSDIEKIAGLEEMLSKAPTHKGAENLRQQLKTKVAKLKQKLERSRIKKAKEYSLTIKKEGAAQVILIGLPNSGKSYILSKISNAKPEIADYPFTTKKPEIGAMDYEGLKIQIVELPAIFKDFYKTTNGPSYFAIMRNGDLLVIALDGSISPEKDIKKIEQEFLKAKIFLGGKKTKNTLPCLVVINKEFKYINTIHKVTDLKNLKKEIWKKLNLIYVFTKTPGKEKDFPPVALKKGSTIKELAGIVHRDFLKRFKFARVWGKSAKHSGANAKLDHRLEDRDVVELHLK